MSERFVHAPYPSGDLSCQCGSREFAHGGSKVKLRELDDKIYLDNPDGTIGPFHGQAACANCPRVYDHTSVWDMSAPE